MCFIEKVVRHSILEFDRALCWPNYCCKDGFLSAVTGIGLVTVYSLNYTFCVFQPVIDYDRCIMDIIIHIVN